MTIATPLTEALGIRLPLIGGAMYPCSNAELVAAVSEAGGIGVLQPVSLVYVHGHPDLAHGIRRIRSLTSGPIGMNVLTERSSQRYLERMKMWLDVALEEGVRFFVSSLGNPRWIVDRVRPAGGLVYHDITERKWALKAAEAGVDGLIAVNDRAGGHAGSRPPENLLAEVADIGLPVVCAGGVSQGRDFAAALDMGYVGVQLGTRLIATTECTAPDEYKRAIVDAGESDIVLTERISGVPVSVIRTPHVERTGTAVGPLTRRLLAHPRTKHFARAMLTLRSFLRARRAARHGLSHRDFFGAGKSVEGIEAVEPVAEIVSRFEDAVATR